MAQFRPFRVNVRRDADCRWWNRQTDGERDRERERDGRANSAKRIGTNTANECEVEQTEEMRLNICAHKGDM